MFGCLFELMVLPLKMIYWFFKIIREIAEHADKHNRYKRHRRR